MMVESLLRNTVIIIPLLSLLGLMQAFNKTLASKAKDDIATNKLLTDQTISDTNNLIGTNLATTNGNLATTSSSLNFTQHALAAVSTYTAGIKPLQLC